MALERAFVKAGGLLLAGTDPTGCGGVIPGYSNQRADRAARRGGLHAARGDPICTLNGATYLGRDDRVGWIAVGKQADLVRDRRRSVDAIADIRNVETVFKQGVGFDPAKLIASVKGKVGLW